jgi:D-alanyl-D-alanine carboxypeptidase (penicillin-binding protein 5/6)
VRKAIPVLLAALALALPQVATAATPAGAPQVSAPSALLVDARDGHVIYADDPDSRSQIASTTKLMTALIALEKLPLDRELAAAPYHPDAAESVINLRPGERMRVDDLLRALLLESANDSAVTLARGAGGSQEKFVRLMNRKARSLHLKNTHYENPVGLDDDANYSTSRDLSKLARRLMRNPFFAQTVKMPSARLLSGAYPRTIENRNDLVGSYPWVTGMKTGHTQKAGYVLVGSGTRNGVKLVSVVLDTPSEGARNSDTLALLNYGFSLYRQAHPVRAGATVAEAKIKYFGDRKAKFTGARTVTLPVRRGQRLRTRVSSPDQVDGPIDKGGRVGTIAVSLDGKRVRAVPLVTAEQVPGASIFRKAAHYLLRWQLLLIVALAAGVSYWRRRRRRMAAEAARRRRRQAARLD